MVTTEWQCSNIFIHSIDTTYSTSYFVSFKTFMPIWLINLRYRRQENANEVKTIYLINDIGKIKQIHADKKLYHLSDHIQE